MADKLLNAGLMGNPTTRQTNPAGRLRQLQQRWAGTGSAPTVPPSGARMEPAPRPGLPPRPGQGTTQSPGGIIPPHMQQPRPGAPVAGAGAGISMQVPQERPMQAPAPLTDGSTPQPMPRQLPSSTASSAPSQQAMPQRPQGAPAAPSGISPTVPGVTMPDVARAPRPAGGLMSAAVPRDAQPILLNRQPAPQA